MSTRRRRRTTDVESAERDTDLVAALQVDTPPGVPTIDAQGRPLLPGFRLLKALGQSRTSQVWKAQLAGGFRPVAIKVLRPEWIDDPEVMRAFMNEGRLLAELESTNGEHPNIVPVLDVGTFGNHLCILMKYMEYGDLARWMAARAAADRSVEIDEFLELAIQVATGVAYLHDNGIIHRDIKPENIFVDRRSGRTIFRLGDLGMAVDHDHGEAASGTPRYMAPEAFLRGAATAMTDVYALGATFFHVLAGQPPFSSPTLAGLSDQVRSAPVPKAHLLNPRVPHELSELIGICLRKEPARRFPDALAVLTALRAVRSDWTVRATGGRAAADERTRTMDGNLPD